MKKVLTVIAVVCIFVPSYGAQSCESVFDSARARYHTTRIAKNKAYAVYEEARVAYERAHKKLPEKAVYEKAVDNVIKASPATLQVAEDLKKTTRIAYFTALSALPEKEVFDAANVTLKRTLEAYESAHIAYEEARARSSLPEQLALEEARVVYEQSHENLPERKVRDQAWEVYLNAERDYYRGLNALPQLAALKTTRVAFMSAEAAFKKARASLDGSYHSIGWTFRNNYSNAKATYESARASYDKIHDSLPQKIVYEHAWEVYLEALVAYYRANNRIVLPVKAALREARKASKKRNFEDLLSSDLLEVEQIVGIRRIHNQNW